MKKILTSIATLSVVLGIIFGGMTLHSHFVQATTITPIAGETYALYGSGISSTQTSIRLTNFTFPATSTEITTAHLGDVMYGVIEPGSNNRQEIISFTGVTQNSDDSSTLTGVTRGLRPFYPYTANSGLAKQHPGGSTFVLSNPPQLYNDIVEYVDAAIFSGAADASTVVKGLVELATKAETALGTAAGGSGPLAIANSSATSSGSTNGSNRVVVTGTDGNIDENFLPTTLATARIFSATTTFDGAIVGTGTTTTRYITASSTWTKPTSPRFKYITVEMVGGGGYGGNTAAADAGGAGGGGCGAYGRFTLSRSQLGSSIFVRIGAAATNTSATKINSTIFTGFATSTAGTKGNVGGGGGTGSAGGAGGTLTTSGVSGLLSISGGSGGPGSGGTTIWGAGGMGCGNPLGTGGGGAFSESGAVSGNAATGYGSGGGGGATSAASAANGGAGMKGVVIITEHY